MSEQKYRLTYRKVESVDTVDEITHPVVRECLKLYGMTDPLSIGTMSDLPGGTGLGSSSSFTVGLINLLHKIKQLPITRKALAEEAINLERNILNEVGGVQDQYHAAFGGLSKYEFRGNKTSIYPLNCPKSRLDLLDKSMFLVYTNVQRSASDVSTSQEKRTKLGNNDEYLKLMYEMVDQGVQILETPGDDVSALTEFGNLLKTGWDLKKNLSDSVSNSNINEIYNTGIEMGAWGGKLLGAGGGGFVLFLGNENLYSQLLSAFGKDFVLKVNLEFNGTQVFSL